MNAARSLFRNPPLLTFVLVALVWLVASFTLRGFGAYGHLRYLLELAAVIGIAAAGQTLVILMGGIDLSVGAVITVTAILLPIISPAWDPTGLVGIALVLAIATGIGFLNGAGAAYLRVPPIIMTLAMATFLQGRVAHTLYPGLASHPQHALAMTQMAAGGTIIALHLEGGRAQAHGLLDALQLIDISNNVGDSRTLMTHPASTTHASMSVEAREEMGIIEGTLRLSVGLEDADDLIDDLDQALKVIGL